MLKIHSASQVKHASLDSAKPALLHLIASLLLSILILIAIQAHKHVRCLEERGLFLYLKNEDYHCSTMVQCAHIFVCPMMLNRNILLLLYVVFLCHMLSSTVYINETKNT